MFTVEMIRYNLFVQSLVSDWFHLDTAAWTAHFRGQEPVVFLMQIDAVKSDLTTLSRLSSYQGRN